MAQIIPDFYLWTQQQAAILRRMASERRVLAVGERGLVNVEIVKKGDGAYQDGATRATTDVKIKTSQGDAVWVPEKDVDARAPNPEESKPV